MDKNKKFLACAGGIFICFFYFGIIQEKITKAQYITEDGQIESFTYFFTLVFMLCFFNLIVSKTLASTIRPYHDDQTKVSYYSLVGLMYVLAMVSTNMSLQFVSYPTQVLAKSSKPIPVLLCGVLFGKKSYSWRKYVNIFIIVTGVALFMYKDNKSSSTSEGTGIGELLLVLSLTMDGLYGAIQERMKSEHQTKPIPMMLNTNLWATTYLAIFVVISGEVFAFVSFVQRHPDVLWKLMTLSVACACGQLCIFETVSEFGPLPTSVVATVRKFFTVITSVILLGNPLLPRQWFAACIVFLGLFLDIYYDKSSPKHK